GRGEGPFPHFRIGGRASALRSARARPHRHRRARRAHSLPLRLLFPGGRHLGCGPPPFAGGLGASFSFPPPLPSLTPPPPPPPTPRPPHLPATKKKSPRPQRQCPTKSK